MTVTVANNSIEKVTSLIRNEFDNLNYWQNQEAQELINAASFFGLNDLANEMKNDLNFG